jgi:hypothetical protein
MELMVKDGKDSKDGVMGLQENGMVLVLQLEPN